MQQNLQHEYLSVFPLCDNFGILDFCSSEMSTVLYRQIQKTSNSPPEKKFTNYNAF